MKNKLTLLFSALLFIVAPMFVQNASAQLEFPEDKVSWKFSVEQDGEDAYVVGKITMVEHWHIYAVHLPEGVFTLPSGVTLTPSSSFKTVGKVIEPKPHFEHDEMADEDLYYHSNTITLKQKIKVTSEKDFKISGKFNFQTCDDTHCLPPYEADFTVNVKGVKAEVEEEVVDELDVPIEDTASAAEIEAPIAMDDANSSSKNDSHKEEKEEGQNTEETEVSKMSMWTIFWLSFAGGFLALLTPCVFPMIPMTVSFFTKQSKTKAEGIRNAAFYGLSIIGIYVLLGVLVIVTKSASLLNSMSTDPWFNLAFFVLLVIFAVSFMGAFEIRMPNKWVNSADSKADKGGFVGIFFMALVLALVSFSCTGPIVGSLLVEASRSGGMMPLVGMFGFSLALALPFALFAAFPGWLNSMPQSGGWLNTVKVVLGFLELALAFKFLSNADLAWQAHMLEREVFLAIWIAIFTVLALYLFGKIMLPHDSPIERLSVGRALFGTFILAFVLYMIPGMWGAPVKFINAFPPPMHYSESPFGVGKSGGSSAAEHGPEGTHLGPQNLWVFHDLDVAKAYAKKVNKPLFVDFTGHNCVNCRKMEQSVWGEEGVIEKLKDDVVIVSLYVDEDIDLPKDKQTTVMVEGREMKIVTVGDKWALYQIEKYNITAQPYYRMLDQNGNDLSNGPASFQNHSNHLDFQEWLDKGLSEFSKK